MSDRISENRLRATFESEGVSVVTIESRAFPQEVHHIVYVTPESLEKALIVGSSFDTESSDSVSEYVIVRKAADSMIDSFLGATDRGPIKSVHDERCSDLIRLVSARSRVSNSQPSLAYVPDARANISAVMAARHHLVFGRRGAGKTALLVEAKRRLETDGAVSVWVNIQTYRRETPQRVVLYVLDETIAALQTVRLVDDRSQIAVSLAELASRVRALLDSEDTEKRHVDTLIPRAQRFLRNYLATASRPLYVFLDDFYYLQRADQPEVLDMLHGVTRDADAWLKVASIKHLTRWWQASPPLGLQSGQDADLIDLDITLQDPAQAKSFLEGVLSAFARKAGIPSLSRVFRSEALDRLVIASGAVPRDYLVLATSAIARAQRRENARLTGVQEVNQAAGDAATSKIQELEEDMASSAGSADVTLSTLKTVRAFCLDDEGFTYFLVGFRDREDRPTAYNLLTDLMDVRLIHLVDAGVSDAHAAGSRYEAFMLDLSQYSGARLKQKVRVLDFSAGHFVSRETRSSSAPRVARTTREFISILRAAPSLDLQWLAEQVKTVGIQGDAPE
jgi:hypothetical protein